MYTDKLASRVFIPKPCASLMVFLRIFLDCHEKNVGFCYVFVSGARDWSGTRSSDLLGTGSVEGDVVMF